MNICVEEKKKEAVARMKKLGILPETIRQFANDGLVSQSLPPVGACFWIEGELLERVRTFEEKYNALVYHVIRSSINIGVVDNYLFIPDCEEKWEYDRKDIERGRQLSYELNYARPDSSGFGYIGFELTPAAGLRRTW